MVQGRGLAAVLRVEPAKALSGTIRMPGDKSISHRYVMLAGVSLGMTEITNLAPGADVAATVSCLRALGDDMVETQPHAVRARGRGGSPPRTPGATLDAQNWGTTTGLLAGLVAGRPIEVT